MAGRRRRVGWTDEARFALDEAVSYIARDSVQGAQAVLEEVLSAADSLSTLPERGRMVPERDESNIREVFVRQYRLMYQVRGSKVLVLAFLHGARDYEKWRSE